MKQNYLEFEKPIATLEGQIRELRDTGSADGIDLVEEINRLEGKVSDEIAKLYKILTHGKKRKWRATPIGRIAAIISKLWLMISRLWPVTGYTQKIAPLWPASVVGKANASPFWGMKKVPIQKGG